MHCKAASIVAPSVFWQPAFVNSYYCLLCISFLMYSGPKSWQQEYIYGTAKCGQEG